MGMGERMRERNGDRKPSTCRVLAEENIIYIYYNIYMYMPHATWPMIIDMYNYLSEARYHCAAL